MADWSWDNLQSIMRRVISRRNNTDTLSGDAILQVYLGQFLRDIFPQETKNFENYDVYDFQTVANDYIYTFNTSNIGLIEGGSGEDVSGQESSGLDQNSSYFENIGPIAFSCDPNNLASGADGMLMNWWQDAGLFFNKWGFIDDVTEAQTGQPTDILFYNNVFELRPVPDGIYTIRIPGYRRPDDFTDDSSGDIPYNYWARYIVYGASLDYMYDFGYDFNRIQVVEKRFQYYKSLVHSHTYNQTYLESPIPRF